MYLHLERLRGLIFPSGMKTVYPHYVTKRVEVCFLIWINHIAYAVGQQGSAVVRDWSNVWDQKKLRLCLSFCSDPIIMSSGRALSVRYQEISNFTVDL